MKKKKGRLRLDRLIAIVLIPIVLFLLIYFVFIKDYQKEKLTKLGYNEKEILFLREKLESKKIDDLIQYSYLSYIEDLINDPNYKDEKLFEYLDYIQNLKIEYKISDITYIINNNIKEEYTEKLSNLINSKYFILKRLERYLSYESDNIEEIITNINSNLDHKFYVDVNSADTSKKYLMLVNKLYYLDENYSYDELVTMDSSYSNDNNSKLNKKAYEAFKKLVDDAELEGYHIRNNSSYRSYETQQKLYNDYKKLYGEKYAEEYSARAGYSEHQTGLALDVGVATKYANGKFESSKEFTWMKENSYKYGFILRYPKGKEYITGYNYEPWHYRYVGIDIATYIHENDITYEEYYAYFIEK